MKEIKVTGGFIGPSEYKVEGVHEGEGGLEINIPSFLLNLLRIKKEIRKVDTGFPYSFPISFVKSFEE